MGIITLVKIKFKKQRRSGQMKVKNHNLKLHMVGKLQSNKAKKAVEVFDYIHSLDNEKLAKVLSGHEKKINKKLKIFYSS